MQRSARFISTLKNSALTAAILLVSVGVGFLFDAMGLREINIYTFFILGILVTAMVTASRLYGVISSICGVLLFNYLFAEPRLSIKAINFGYPMDFIILLCVSILVSTLAQTSERMSFRTRTLLATDQMFLKATGTEEILSITARQLHQLLGRPLVFFMADDQKLGAPQCFGQTVSSNEWDDDAAHWTYIHGDPSGARTPRFTHAACYYTAIRTADRTLGVVGVSVGDRSLTDMEISLLQAVLSECALTLERDFFDQKRQEAAIQMRNEKLRADLLRSISHDLRTPLTCISGNASLLSEQSELLTNEQKLKLTQDIRDDAQWLLGTVENLLAVTRIEDGRMAMKLQPEMISDVISEAVSHLAKHDSDHTLSVEQEDDMLMAHIDARLIMQVIVNLVDNAKKYTPHGSSITIRTLKQGHNIVVEVADTGPGVPENEKHRVFDMFYTTSVGAIDGRRGLGLGLALCKAIVNAHGGEISIRDNFPHGAVFAFTLQEERIEMT